VTRCFVCWEVMSCCAEVCFCCAGCLDPIQTNPVALPGILMCMGSANGHSVAHACGDSPKACESPQCPRTLVYTQTILVHILCMPINKHTHCLATTHVRDLPKTCGTPRALWKWKQAVPTAGVPTSIGSFTEAACSKHVGTTMRWPH
jgi:hypothetical protein